MEVDLTCFVDSHNYLYLLKEKNWDKFILYLAEIYLRKAREDMHSLNFKFLQVCHRDKPLTEEIIRKWEGNVFRALDNIDDLLNNPNVDQELKYFMIHLRNSTQDKFIRIRDFHIVLNRMNTVYGANVYDYAFSVAFRTLIWLPDNVFKTLKQAVVRGTLMQSSVTEVRELGRQAIRQAYNGEVPMELAHTFEGLGDSYIKFLCIYSEIYG